MIGGFGEIKHFFITVTSKSNEYITPSADINKNNLIADSLQGNNRQNSKSSFKLGPYLAGLIEADGSIAVHKNNSKVQKYRPKIIVVFSLADKPLADRLAFITQSGKVYLKTSAGCVL